MTVRSQYQLTTVCILNNNISGNMDIGNLSYILAFIVFLVSDTNNIVSYFVFGLKYVDSFAFLNILDFDNFCYGIWETAKPEAGV